jgi:sodium transport system permease protein
VYLVCTLPAIVAALPGSKLTLPLAFAPGANLALLAKDLVQGKAPWDLALIALGATFVYASLLVMLAARLYASERVLFADSDRELGFFERLRLLVGLGAAPASERRASPSAAEAMALLAINVVLLIFAALPLQQRDVARGLLVSQWGFLFGSTVLMLRASNVSLRSALLLAWPAPRQLGAGLLAGLAASVIVHAVFHFIIQRSEALQKANEQLAHLVDVQNLPIALFIFAITPAVCEELLFRGALLSGLRRAVPAPTAIVLQAILFGLFHMDPVRLVPTTVLGLLLGYVAVQSRSLLPGALLHAANNGCAILIAHFGLGERLRPDGPLGIALALGAVVVLALAIRLSRAPAASR